MAEPQSDTTWISRFGTLVDVTRRPGRKGDFVTFKLQAKDFVQYGACFDPSIMTEMEAAVGQAVWMRGPIEQHPGRDAAGATVVRTSFKVVKFKLSAQGAEAA